jgi:hypothetical protein
MGRGIVLIVVAAVVATALVWTILGPRRPRRVASTFVESFELAPIVDGALPGAARGRERGLSAGRSTTRFWRRAYNEARFTLTAKLDSGEVVPFVRAVRDSIEDRLGAVKATVRGVGGENWPEDSLGFARSDLPMALTMPYATRRRVGWVTVRAIHSGADGLTMWVTLLEGPRPSD